MATILCPAQRQAFEGLLRSMPVGSVFVLSGATGMGKTTVLREVHHASGGRFLTMKDFVHALRGQHPLACDETFERMVMEALASVPEPSRRYLDTVQVVVEPEPTIRQRRAMGLRRRDTLYGLYEGLTVPERLSSGAGGSAVVLPSVVTLFRRSLAGDFPDEEELRREVRRTLFHELAHHFGIEDDRLEELGAY